MHEDLERLLSDGYLARKQNRSNEAKQLFEEAVELSRNTSDSPMLARALSGLGQIERDLDNTETARQHYQASVQILRELNDPMRLAHTVRHLGDILQQQGRSELAQPSYEEALSIYRANDSADILDVANTVAGYARCQQSTGKLLSARRLWLEARDLYTRVDVQGGVDEANKKLAILDASLAALPD